MMSDGMNKLAVVFGMAAVGAAIFQSASHHVPGWTLVDFLWLVVGVVILEIGLLPASRSLE